MVSKDEPQNNFFKHLYRSPTEPNDTSRQIEVTKDFIKGSLGLKLDSPL